MDTTDKVGYILVGCVIGYIMRILHEILRELRDVDECVHECRENHRHNRPRDRNEDGILRMHPWVLDFVLFVVVIMTVFGVLKSIQFSDKLQENYHDDKVARCVAGAENRMVQRALVESIYKLASKPVQRKAGDAPLTPAQARAYNSYIRQVNGFREDMYDQIKPSEECEPYVTDDDLEPPTENIPLIPSEGKHFD